MRLIDADHLRKRVSGWTPYSQAEYGARYEFGVMIDHEPTVATDTNVLGKWISVKDRMPEEKINPYTQDYQEVICLLSTRFGSDVRVYKFGGGHFWNGPCDIDKYITHWMYLPEPPQEVTGDAD
jgi:hypothetical protein